jgi:hypothetical protein
MQSGMIIRRLPANWSVSEARGAMIGGGAGKDQADDSRDS